MTKIIRIIVKGIVKILTGCACLCRCFGCSSSCININVDNDDKE